MTLYENAYKNYTKCHFYEFLVVICSISLKKLKIFIIKIPKDSLFIFLVLHAVIVTFYHVKVVQDDISAKSVPI